MFFDRSPDFRVETEFDGDTAIVRLGGEVDVTAQPALVAALDAALAAQPIALIVDLRGLSFMDSSGIHALVRTERRCREAGQRFALVQGQAAVARLLQLTGVAERFEILDDLSPAAA